MVPAALALPGSRELHILLVQLHVAGLVACASPHAMIPLPTQTVVPPRCGHQSHTDWFRHGHM